MCQNEDGNAAVSSDYLTFIIVRYNMYTIFGPTYIVQHINGTLAIKLFFYIKEKCQHTLSDWRNRAFPEKYEKYLRQSCLLFAAQCESVLF